MSVLLVTYDLRKEKTKKDYDGFYAVIKTYAWARLSESSYAIDTMLSPTQIYDALSPYIDSNDSVEVITLAAPYWGRHDAEVMKWLQNRL